MSRSTNNGTLGTSFGQEDEREWAGYYTLASRQQNTSVVDSSCSELHSTSGPRRESYVPAQFAPSTWPSAASLDPPFAYGRGGWPGDERLHDVHLGSTFGAPRGNTDASGMNQMGMEVAAPVLEQAFPAASRALPVSQPCPPSSLIWPQTSSRSTSSWGQSVHTARQHGHYNSSVDFLTTRPENPPFQTAASSVTTGLSERRFMPTGSLHLITTQNFVQHSTLSDPVPAASSAPRPRGERWDFSNDTTFPCLWRRSRCTARIAGNRRSVTNHLRSEHNFANDGQTIVCAWDGCTAYMQRRNIPRHILTCHLEVKVTCPHCGLALSRADANKKHRQACMGARVPVVVETREEDEGGYF